MDELERLRDAVRKVRQAANGARIWHTVLDPLEILEIVGREDPAPEMVIVSMQKTKSRPSPLRRLQRYALRRKSEAS